MKIDGTLNLSGCRNLISLKNLKEVKYGISLSDCVSLESLELTEGIEGSLSLENCYSLKFINIAYVYNSVHASYCKKLEIINFKSIGDNSGRADFNSCKSLKSLGPLKFVGGFLDLENCESLESLGDLEEVTGEIYLKNCKNLFSLGKLRKCGGNLILGQSKITPDYIRKEKPNLMHKCKW
jgi:hypothetical protein